MTVQRWLGIAAGITLLLILLVSVAAWRSAFPGPRSAEEIRAEAAEQMNRIEARGLELERNASGE